MEGSMTISDHEFGGVSTDLKLSMVQRYLSGFTTALRGKFNELWYIDAFAGTGERTVRLDATEANLFDDETPERVERRRGSAQIAVDTNPAFNRLIFMDRKAKHCDALRTLATANPFRKIDVLQGDANDEIRCLLANRSWTSTRAVMFLDPYGMSVEWETLKAIRSTQAIDVWYFVSLSGLFRQAARDGNAVDDSKRLALNRMLGTSEWEKEWYQASTADLFGDSQISRIANVQAIEAYVGKRLEILFPKVLKPRTFYSDRGVPMFALFFAMSNPDAKAIGLATKIASHILNSGKSSHVRPR
jgi:three-Cys-motif partner protein